MAKYAIETIEFDKDLLNSMSQIIEMVEFNVTDYWKGWIQYHGFFVGFSEKLRRVAILSAFAFDSPSLNL